MNNTALHLFCMDGLLLGTEWCNLEVGLTLLTILGHGENEMLLFLPGLVRSSEKVTRARRMDVIGDEPGVPRFQSAWRAKLHARHA